MLKVLRESIKNLTPREHAALNLTFIVEYKMQVLIGSEVECNYTFHQ
jgi:hypothetical protein